MDIGSAAYTEFDVEPSVIAYMCNHPELLDCQMGLIHSHNNMATFFSGTDTTTLREEGNKRNHFVSLIVNNAGTYTAGITRKVDIERTISDTCTFRSYEDTLWNLVGDDDIKKETLSEIEWVEFNIEKATISNEYNELDERIAEIKQRKTAKTPKVAGQDFVMPQPRSFGQLSLFDDELDTPDPKAIDDIPLIEKNDEELNRVVHSYFLQLLTGAVSISDESKINVDRWASNMKHIFDRRFGGTKNYKAWAEGFCEFLVMYPIAKYKDVDEFEYAEYIALGIIEKLKKLKENKYINTLISVLSQWTVE